MLAVLRREMRGKLSAAVRRSAGGSGFPDTPAGTSAGVGRVDVGRAADCAGDHFPRAHGTGTSHFFTFELLLMWRRRSSENGRLLHCVCMGVGYELKIVFLLHNLEPEGPTRTTGVTGAPGVQPGRLFQLISIFHF